jgi:NAD(P)-dependent dehydrogenase (short-subunit alcohol dehydrogenase family)
MATQAGTSMKVVLIGAGGKIGSAVAGALADQELIRVGRSSGDHRADLSDRASLRALFQKVGRFDAVACASGHVAFAPFAELTPAQWRESLDGKLLGQIQLVQEALPFINEGGSFTLVSGILGDEPIRSGVAASTVNRALEGFVMAAAAELPKGLRINLVSPTLLEESKEDYAPFFPGFVPVEGWKVGQAYRKAILGIQTGRVFRVA